MPTEQWRPVPGYEGMYEVSDHGSVRSLDRLDSIGRRRHGGVMSQKNTTGGRGHKLIDLSRDGVTKTLLVHRLVLGAFVGPAPEGTEGCHNDGDPANNRVENLRWDTKSANAQDRLRHGRHNLANQTHCLRGHELAGANLIPSNLRHGGRACLTCHTERRLARRQGVLS